MYNKYHYTQRTRKIVTLCECIKYPLSGIQSSAGVFPCEKIRKQMSIKSIAALAASPFLFAGAAFAGPYVNIEANGSYPDGAYSSGNVEFQVGYEGTTTNGINWYASVGPTVNHTETADEFGDVEIAGYLGGGKSLTEKTSVYGEIYGASNNDDVDWSGKAGLRYTF